ncbi:TonB-dependent receptor [Maricurvus nonylphenolicus]|uniref:TonB-dependent receptor n=1 Tax=Maricurvus nonylphenolicus TaxID=1008307 RepID=UPI0036F35927
MYSKQMYKRSALYSAIALASSLGCSQAIAAAEEFSLEEIIVTAQKREQSVQDIPLTVSVVGGESLEKFSITNATDLAKSVPGLSIAPAPQGLSSPKVRGLGTGVGAETLDQSVGLFIDGVWSGRPRDLQAALFDVERVEVIKGTQTSQLGKNTSLGAIQVFSVRPTEETEGYLKAEYDFELGSKIYAGAGNLNTEFGSYRLAVNMIEEQGYVEDELSGGDGPDREQLTARLGGLWTIGDAGELYISYTYDDLEVTGDHFQVSSDPTGFYTLFSGDTDVTLDDKRKTFTSLRNDGKPYDEQKSHKFLAEYTHDFNGDMEFVSLTAYSSYDNDRYLDADFSALDFIDQKKETSYKQVSQEFRISGSAFDSALDYVTGIYYLESEFEYYEETLFDSDLASLGVPANPLDPTDLTQVAAFGPGTSNIDDVDQDVEVLSLYAHGTYALTEDLNLAVGIRYTDESREMVWTNAVVDNSAIYDVITTFPVPTLVSDDYLTAIGVLGAGFANEKLERSESNVDGSINLQYSLGEVGHVYASWAKGSKSGGFTTQVTDPDLAEFDTEEAETIELGFKAEMLDNRLRINGAVFFTEIDDFQSVSYVGTGFLTETIPVESQGAEIEGLYAATEALTLGFSATYTDAEVKDTGLDPSGISPWDIALTLAHETNLTDGFQLSTDVSVSYRDSHYAQGGETIPIPTTTLVDFRIALSPQEGDWEVALMARNLFDEQKENFGYLYPILGEAVLTTIHAENRPRTVALQAQYNF